MKGTGLEKQHFCGTIVKLPDKVSDGKVRFHVVSAADSFALSVVCKIKLLLIQFLLSPEHIRSPLLQLEVCFSFNSVCNIGAVVAV